jgi:hypothetical protein
LRRLRRTLAALLRTRARLAGRTRLARWAWLTRLLRLLLRLGGVLRLRRTFAAIGTAASASAASALRELLLAGREHDLRFGAGGAFAGRTRLARRTRIAGWSLLRALPRLLALTVASGPLLLLLLLLGLRLAAALGPAALFRALLAVAALAAALARPLLELPHLPVHELPGLVFLPVPELVVAAVRATLPPLGIHFLAGVAEDAFREGHRESARIVHFEGVTDDRRKTLQVLIELAEESSPTACWDDGRAIELLRAQTTAAELRELGASEGLIEHVFAEPHGA